MKVVANDVPVARAAGTAAQPNHDCDWKKWLGVTLIVCVCAGLIIWLAGGCSKPDCATPCPPGFAYDDKDACACVPSDPAPAGATCRTPRYNTVGACSGSAGAPASDLPDACLAGDVQLSLDTSPCCRSPFGACDGLDGEKYVRRCEDASCEHKIFPVRRYGYRSSCEPDDGTTPWFDVCQACAVVADAASTDGHGDCWVPYYMNATNACLAAAPATAGWFRPADSDSGPATFERGGQQIAFVPTPYPTSPPVPGGPFIPPPAP